MQINIRKHTDIIIGILLGATVGAALIFTRPLMQYIALAQEETPTQDYAAGDDSAISKTLSEKIAGSSNMRLDYNDVFGSATYKNLYLMIYQITLVKPEDDAFKQIAANYGMTQSEAAAVYNGSILPVANRSPPERSQQDIYNRANQLRSDFNDLYDVFSLQQELNLASAASEVFSNGNVADSGFDLVHDLDIIEEILFGQKSKSTLGGPLDFGGNSEKDLANEMNPQEEAPKSPSIPDVYNSLNKTQEPASSGGDESKPPEQQFDPTKLVEIAQNDVCPKPETALEKSLSEFKKEEEQKSNQNGEQPSGTGSGSTPETPSGSGSSTVKHQSLLNKVKPENPDDWSNKINCDGYAYGVEAGKESKISTAFYLCLELKTKWETYSTIVPDAPCVSCELQKILAYMNKTVEHSLVPNKVTGNFLEPSKCKSALIDSIDIKFNMIWSPIMTPPKGDAILGKNIFVEWEKFLNRSHPLLLEGLGRSLLPDHIDQVAADTAMQNTEPDANYTAIMEQVNQVRDTFTKQQAENIDKFDSISEGENFVTYSQDVLREVNQMTKYFQGFKTTFETLANETCPSILNKQKIN